jgi:hypothetical protein
MSDDNVNEQCEHAGLICKVLWDQDPHDAMSPRDNDGILGRMWVGGAGDDHGLGHAPGDYASEHKPDELLDIRDSGSMDLTMLCPDCKGGGEVPAHDGQHTVDCEPCEGSGEVEGSVPDYFKSKFDSRVVMPLFMLDHSGITIRTGANIIDHTDPDDVRQATRSSNRFVSDGAGWDTSFIGFVFDSKATREHCGCEDWDAKRIEESIDSEINEYDSLLRGEVYYWTVETKDGDVLETICGYIGDAGEKAAMDDAKESADAHRANLDKEAREARYWLEREVLTV